MNDWILHKVLRLCTCFFEKACSRRSKRRGDGFEKTCSHLPKRRSGWFEKTMICSPISGSRGRSSLVGRGAMPHVSVELCPLCLQFVAYEAKGKLLLGKRDQELRGQNDESIGRREAIAVGFELL